MNTLPLMLTAKDDELLGVSNRSHVMGVLTVWSVLGVEDRSLRGREWEESTASWLTESGTSERNGDWFSC